MIRAPKPSFTMNGCPFVLGTGLGLCKGTCNLQMGMIHAQCSAFKNLQRVQHQEIGLAIGIE